MFGLSRPEPKMVGPAQALPGRDVPVLAMPTFHRITGDPLDREFPGAETTYLGLGCFWGAEKLFWQTPGVLSTAVGYMGGYTPNPSYEEVCSGQTGHAEVVRVVFDPSVISYEQLLHVFYENHNPTTANRQGNDIGTQYRSAIYTVSDDQANLAHAVTSKLSPEFEKAEFGSIITDIAPAGDWFYAEDYHQQYLDANPNGYDCRHATGVSCPTPKTEPELTE